MATPGHAEPEFPVACVVLGGARTLSASLAAAEERKPGVRAVDMVVRSAAEAGADPVIAVVPASVEVAAPARRVVCAEHAGFATTVRLGLAQLANSGARAALLWPVEVTDVELTTVLAVLDAGKRMSFSGVAPSYDGRPGYPYLVARSTWSDVMALADGGPDAIFALSPASMQRVPVEDPAILLASKRSSPEPP